MIQPGEYRNMQNRINRLTAVRTLALLGAADPKSGREWARLASLLYAVVSPQRIESHQLALAYYASHMPSGNAPPVPLPDYTPEMTGKALSRFRIRWETSDADRVAVRPAATAAMVRHGEQGGRDTVVQATSRDGIRWARMDPRPPCCSWCTLFVSRGPVYLNDGDRSGGFMAHDFDTCVPVPVRPDQRDWPGREQYEAAEAFYVEHAAGHVGEQIERLRKAVAQYGSPI